MKIDKQWVKANYNGEESFTIPDSVTSIDDCAFISCESLKSITIPNSVTSIGARAFFGCTSLESIIIPDSVTEIGVDAFSFCQNLTEATIPDSVTKIENGAFLSCESLESVTIPDSVTSIGNMAFEYCKSLKNITIPDSVTKIGYEAFWGCKSLESLSIPDGVTSIGNYAFGSCKSIESITIPDNVTSIGRGVFEDCHIVVSYNGGIYPSYMFMDENTLNFLRKPEYEDFMRIEVVPIKARLALDYIDSDERFVECVRENCAVLIKLSAENEDWDALDIILKGEHNLLQPEQLDECMEFAVENNHQELSVLLMQYKERIGRYDKDDDRFELGL